MSGISEYGDHDLASERIDARGVPVGPPGAELDRRRGRKRSSRGRQLPRPLPWRDPRVRSGPAWFVVNPHAGGVSYDAVSRAIRRGLGPRAATISSELPDPSEARTGLVVAVGGDGTVSRVINGCDPGHLRLGLIPRGSANDLATELVIPHDFERAWDVLEGGRHTEIDLISVNGRRFATCGGMGFATEVATRANQWKARSSWQSPLVRPLGPLVYPLATLAEVQASAQRPIRATIRARGIRRSVDLSTALISNQPRLGGCFTASPLASNRDGHLHLCGMEAPRSRARLLWLCAQFYAGKADCCREIFQIRERSLTIETEDDVTFFGDGEALAHGRRFRLEVLPRALSVAVPRRGAKVDHA